MERYDVYNEDRELTGKVLDRGQVCEKGENRLVVHICIFNSKNEMLIQKRVKSKKVAPGRWDLSVGGCSMSGEKTKQTAHREMLEEIGLDYDFTHHRPHLTINFEHGFDDYYFIEKDMDLTTLVLQREEVDEVRWASLDEILELLRNNQFVPYMETFIISLFELRKQYGVIYDYSLKEA